MINSVISALIAIFFWGKPSKKEKERIRKASLMRTMIYLILSIIVLVFYIKTNQVATIYNQLNVDCGLADFNSKGEPLDTIYSVDIYNRFSSSTSYSNDITNYMKHNYMEHGELYSERGGMAMQIGVCRTRLDSIKYGRLFSDEDYYCLKEDIPDVNHFFLISYLGTSIPSIIPIYPKQNERTRWEKESHVFYKNIIENTRDNKYLFFYQNSEDYLKKKVDSSARGEINMPKIFENGSIMGQEIGSRNLQSVTIDEIIREMKACNVKETDIDTTKITLTSYCAFRFFNNLNIFTAADISQYAYVISCTSELPINSISINYDVPIDLPSSDESMTVGPTSIFIDGAEWNYFKEYTTVIYVKLPTLANVQLIRSFVLTTLLTILFSLFFRNVYYWMRKMALRYKLRHSLPYSKAKLLSPVRITIFRSSIYAIIIGFFSLSLYLTWLVFNGNTLLIKVSWLEHWEYILGVVIAIIVIVPLLLHYYASLPLKAKVKKEDDFQNYIDDLYEKRKLEEDEEMEKLFNEHIKEMGCETETEEMKDN